MHTAQEHLELHFGSLSLEVLYQTTNHRVSRQIAREKKGAIIAYNAVEFLNPVAEIYLSVDKQIRAGAPLGKTFQEAGIPFERHVEEEFLYCSQGSLQEIFATTGTFFRFKRLSFNIGTHATTYARICEIYSPLVVDGANRPMASLPWQDKLEKMNWRDCRTWHETLLK
ncbi:hypothetical protein HYV86_02925 [Candidatus Woesearchaeota archaeon]|nr:hypothetical protein [Candidatus Woesearchaeota archaeon]